MPRLRRVALYGWAVATIAACACLPLTVWGQAPAPADTTPSSIGRDTQVDMVLVMALLGFAASAATVAVSVRSLTARANEHALRIHTLEIAAQESRDHRDNAAIHMPASCLITQEECRRREAEQAEQFERSMRLLLAEAGLLVNKPR